MTYSISVIVTILVTAFLAFYYLYKSKELNLGILMSISIGAVILGFTFNPAYNTIFSFLKSTANVNRRLGFLFSLAIVLLFFLILIVSISMLVAICLPARLSSIDCCVAIDRFVAKNRNEVKSQEIENTAVINENNEHVLAAELTYGGDAPVEAEMTYDDDSVEVAATEDTRIEDVKNMTETENSMISNEANDSDFGDLPDSNNDLIPEDEERVLIESSSEEKEDKQTSNENVYTVVNEAELLVLKAFDCKVKGQREQAVQYYSNALNYSSLDREMVFWIVLDICTLYKELGLNELACNILNGVSERFGDMLKPEIRMEITNNLK